MHKGITPVIAVILLLLVTISITGFAFMFFGRISETASQQTETELEHQASAIGENFVVESVDNNRVYIRNLGREELNNLNFYVNGVRVDSSGTVPAGQSAAITLNDAQLAQLPNDAKLKVTSLGTSREENTKFYKEEVVGYWKFDEADRDKAADYSGNGNDGTFVGETWNDGDLKPACPNCPQLVEGKSGNALQFDGADDYISSTLNGINTALGQFNTITFWVYWDGTATGGIPLGFNQYDVWFMDTSCIGFNTGNGDAYGINPSSAGIIGKWTHITALFYNGPYTGNNKLYVNGVEQTLSQCAGTVSTQSATANFAMGRWAGYSTNYFKGIIDEVRIYSRALTQQEIIDDMNSPYPVVRPVASYSFEKFTGNGKAQDTHNIVKGKYGAAMSFDGVDDYVNINGINLGIANKDFTLEVWYAPSSALDSWKTMLSVGGSSFESSYNIIDGRWLGGLTAGSQNDNGLSYTEIFYNNYVTVNGWNSIAITHKKSENKLYAYLNSQYIDYDSYAGNLVTPGNNVKVGAGNSLFNGVIDEVRILNVARPMA